MAIQRANLLSATLDPKKVPPKEPFAVVRMLVMTAHGRDPDASGQGISDTSAGHDSLGVS